LRVLGDLPQFLTRRLHPPASPPIDQMVRYASPKNVATASATPGDWTYANGDRTQSNVDATTASGRTTRSQALQRWNRPTTRAMERMPTEPMTAAPPDTAPHSRSMRWCAGRIDTPPSMMPVHAAN